MRLAADNEAHPLSPALTKRVVTYLNVFRLAIALALLAAWAGGALIESSTVAGSAWPPFFLMFYLAIAMALTAETRSPGKDIYRIAQRSMILDVVMISATPETTSPAPARSACRAPARATPRRAT